MEKFKNVDKLVSQLKPSNPVYCIRGESLKKASNFFQKNFKGKILYAVKTNPNKFVLKTLYNSGLKNFDIAEQECKNLLEQKLPLPAYDQCLKASHIFNLLDARGVIAVAERTGYINRIRELAKGAGSGWLENQDK